MDHRYLPGAIFALISFGSHFAFAGAGITYSGRLLKNDGSPVTSSSVQFHVQIRTPGNESCLLYQETHSIDMSNSNGMFALTINDGTATAINTEPFTLDRVFQNRGNFSFAGGKCVVGSTYAPNPSDGRKLVVEFDDGSGGGFETLPAQAINFIPMSMESMTVGGYGSGSMLRVNDGAGAPAAISALTQTQYNTLVDLLAGNSTTFLNSSSALSGANLGASSVADAKIIDVSGSKISGNISGNAAGFTGSLAGDVTGAQGTTVVGKIQGRAIDTATPTNGQVLSWNQSNTRWEPTTLATSSSGTVTSVSGTGGLTGTVTTSGSLSLANIADKTVLANTSGSAGSPTSTTLSDLIDSALSGSARGNLLYRGASGWTILSPGTSGNVLKTQGANADPIWASATAGSVTSVDVSVPSILSVSGGPITSSGTIAVSLATQSSKTVFAGPVSGGAAAPTFRALNIGDIQSTNTGSFLSGGACTTGQALVYNSPADTISCASISLTSSQVTTALSYTPVNKAGDTMTGTLNLPSDGLTIGTSQLVMSSGKVGIGTATPGSKLDVVGNISSSGSMITNGDFYLSRTTSNYGFVTRPNTAGYKKLGFVVSGGGNLENFDVYSDSASFSGNVGFGTMAPASKLDIVGDLRLSGLPSYILGDYSNSNFANRTMFKTTTANSNTVLVAVPDNAGGSNANPGAGYSAFNNPDPTNAGRVVMAVDQVNAYVKSERTGSGTYLPFSLYTSGLERVRIDTAGNVGVGTTTPAVALDVAGAVRAGSSATVTSCGLGAANGEGSQRYNYTSHQMEFCNGTTWLPLSSSAGGNGFSTMVTLTTPGSSTWTVPAGVTKIKVTVVGAGGGGCTTGGSYGNGGGGGGGGTAIQYFTVTAGASLSYTIGTGGAQLASGGNSTFGPVNSVTLQANGGSPGVNGNGADGGVGGTATGGALNIPGGKGGAGNWSSGYSYGSPGNGGSSSIGPGAAAPSGLNAGSSYAASAAYGGGGAGGSATSLAQSSGANGVILIEY